MNLKQCIKRIENILLFSPDGCGDKLLSCWFDVCILRSKTDEAQQFRLLLCPGECDGDRRQQQYERTQKEQQPVWMPCEIEIDGEQTPIEWLRPGYCVYIAEVAGPDAPASTSFEWGLRRKIEGGIGSQLYAFERCSCIELRGISTVA